MSAGLGNLRAAMHMIEIACEGMMTGLIVCIIDNSLSLTAHRLIRRVCVFHTWHDAIDCYEGGTGSKRLERGASQSGFLSVADNLDMKNNG